MFLMDNINKKKFDLIIFGASGFTGRLIVEYILNNYGALNNYFKWAISGRNREKLERLKQELYYLNSNIESIPIIISDSFNVKNLDNLAQQTKSIISTVGPYLKYGRLLIASCVKYDTDYFDLTGEVPFIRESIDNFNSKAKCKIVHSCGFDSLPSDMGVMFLQDYVYKKTNTYCTNIKLYVKGFKGGFSGGTLSSILNIDRYIKENPDLKGLLGNPYALNPRGMMVGNDKGSQRGVLWDLETSSWTAPFIMAGINSRNIRRSNALNGFKYGEDFCYNEVMSFKKGIIGYIKSRLVQISIGLFVVLLKLKVVNYIMRKFILTKPGKGPSKSKRENGYFNLIIIGKTKTNHVFKARVIGDRDPGYESTAKMIVESALSSILNQDKTPQNKGVLTPSVALGSIPIERLKDKGIRFEII